MKLQKYDEKSRREDIEQESKMNDCLQEIHVAIDKAAQKGELTLKYNLYQINFSRLRRIGKELETEGYTVKCYKAKWGRSGHHKDNRPETIVVRWGASAQPVYKQVARKILCI